MHLSSFFGALKLLSEAIQFKVNIVNAMLFGSQQNACHCIAAHISIERQKVMVNSIKMLATAVCGYNL